MNKELLCQANELESKIKSKQEVLKVLDKLEKIENVTITDYNNGRVVIPQELKPVLFTLIKSHFQTQLSELEKEFDEL